MLKAHSARKIKRSKKLKFLDVDGRDVYNIAAPVKIKKMFYILGRVERREEETATKVMFFRRPQHSKAWYPDKQCPIFDLQDPFITKIKDTIVFGGVETKQLATSKHLGYRTVFYRGRDIHNLRKFAHGPWGMKGIRLIQLQNQRILVFTRPQGKKGRRGKIGCVEIDSLSQLKSRTLSRASMIEDQFARGEWGGVNEVHLLGDGKIGVLGHVAKLSRKKTKHYYPIIFSLDLELGVISKMKIIASRKNLPKGESKRSDLHDVIYPGGIIRSDDGAAKLYAGVSDAEAYEITIDDPFLEYEAPVEEFEEQDFIEQQLDLAEQLRSGKVF